MIKRTRQESILDKLQRFRGAITVVTIPLVLISLVLLLIPSHHHHRHSIIFNRRNSIVDKQYAVIIDAGSSGSRVHVYCFDHNFDLVPIGDGLELFIQIKPGLSAYASNPEMAVYSLRPLLQGAESVVPKGLWGETPVRVGATAGLRLLEGDTADRILQGVRDYLKEKSPFQSKPDWVTVLDGTQEGAYEWEGYNNGRQIKNLETKMSSHERRNTEAAKRMEERGKQLIEILELLQEMESSNSDSSRSYSFDKANPIRSLDMKPKLEFPMFNGY